MTWMPWSIWEKSKQGMYPFCFLLASKRCSMTFFGRVTSPVYCQCNYHLQASLISDSWPHRWGILQWVPRRSAVVVSFGEVAWHPNPRILCFSYFIFDHIQRTIAVEGDSFHFLLISQVFVFIFLNSPLVFKRSFPSCLLTVPAYLFLTILLWTCTTFWCWSWSPEPRLLHWLVLRTNVDYFGVEILWPILATSSSMTVVSKLERAYHLAHWRLLLLVLEQRSYDWHRL